MRQWCRFDVRNVFAAALMVTGCGGRAAPAAVPISPAQPPPDAEPGRVVWPYGPVASGSVARGELVGLVVDAATAKPLALAQITSGRPPSPIHYTDSTGHFRMPMPNAEALTYVRRIGYESYSTVIRAPGDSGAAIVFALRRAEIATCIVFTGPSAPSPHVVVFVHDAMTGRSPTAPVSVVVQAPAFRDSVVASADSTDRVVVQSAFDRPGTYHVTVRSQGYHEWSGLASASPVPGCPGEFRPAVVHIWLIPN